MNAHGGVGRWAWDVALEPADVPEVLERSAGIAGRVSDGRRIAGNGRS